MLSLLETYVYVDVHLNSVIITKKKDICSRFADRIENDEPSSWH
jgi:hypothetical protein